eukprot:COSAG06_NODE_2201_length_7352_cov_18.385771_8_plen_420_part_00
MHRQAIATQSQHGLAETAREEMAGFGPAHPGIALLEGKAVAKMKSKYGSFYTAASGATLSGGGLHAARFTVRKGWNMLLEHDEGGVMSFGAIRADWDVEGGVNAHEVQGHCFYATGSGQRCPGWSDWEGRQPAMEEGDRIDMLLDLGVGSMTVFKNGEPLGVMQESGLGGAGMEYRWAVGLYNKGDSARIEAVPAAEVQALVQAMKARVAQQLEREAQQERERLARIAIEQDLALPAGTRLRVQDHASDGVYQRWERRTFGANAHFIDFGAEGGGVQQVALKGLTRSLGFDLWSVLPPLAALVVTVRALEMTGGEAVEIKDVSLDWSVSRLNATIAERRGVSADLQRLVVGDTALDDADALLSLCGVCEGTLVHVVAQAEGAAAARAAADAAGIEEGQPPTRPQRQQQRRGGWCCASPA